MTAPRRKPPEPPPTDRLLRMADVCRLVATPRRTLNRLISGGKFPPPDLRMGNTPRWRLSTIEAFIQGRWKG